MTTEAMNGIHIRQMAGHLNTEVVGPNGIIKGDTLRSETLTLDTPRHLHYSDQPVLGVVLPGGAGNLAWDDTNTELPVWSWFYIPRNYRVELKPVDEQPISVVLLMPVRADQARWESSAEGEPIVVPLEDLKKVVKEGRVCYNAAGDGFPIDKSYFMGSYCIYDLKYGEMPQHVHEDQEEFMVILKTTGTHSGFLIDQHSLDLTDWTIVHVFQGFWHGFSPAADGLISIIALYLDPVSGGCAGANDMAAEDLSYWQSTCDNLADYADAR